MGEESNSLNVQADEVVNGRRRVTFGGFNWGGRGIVTVVCPRCSCRHHFTIRKPRQCRICAAKFLYTANEAKAG